MTQKLDVTRSLDELMTMTDAQARELRAVMLSTGQLPPPAELITLSPEELGASVEQLVDVLGGQALAWAEMDSAPPSVKHFSNGLIYAGSMLRSCRQLDPAPLNVLAIFTTWAASFTREVLQDCGYSAAQTDAVFDDLGVRGEQLRQVLDTLPHDMARGGFMAAVSAFHASAHSMSEADPEALHGYFVAAGRDLAGPNWRPPAAPGGLKA
jgi:hypothetical protein